MQSMRIRIFLVLIILVLIYPSLSRAATEQRIALVIGNSAYSSGPLKNPVNDATDMASALKRVGFDVILKKNTNHKDMEDSIRDFGDRLRKGGVGLFFYAGHGVQLAGKNYLIPIGSNMARETDVKYSAVDAEMILDEMGSAGNNVNIVILDACRDNPFGKNFRTANRGLAIVSSAPRGTFISYSTGPGKIAADGGGLNSPYTNSLVKHIETPGLPIEEVFKNVRRDIGSQTKGQQVPWELSSLEGQFFFVPRSGKIGIVKAESVVSKISPTDELESEREKLRQERELLEQRKALAEERRKLEEERKTLAMWNRPSAPAVNEIKRDGRFIAYENGTVLDTHTYLMWAARDNGSDINWHGAKAYCENYRRGGYTDWRMPTQDELTELYDKNKGYTPVCAARSDNDKVYLTDLINMSCWAGWASEARGSAAAYFHFWGGERGWYPQSLDIINFRALPVRSAK